MPRGPDLRFAVLQVMAYGQAGVYLSQQSSMFRQAFALQSSLPGQALAGPCPHINGLNLLTLAGFSRCHLLGHSVSAWYQAYRVLAAVQPSRVITKLKMA